MSVVKELVESEQVREIAQSVIRENRICVDGARIVYQEVVPYISKKQIAKVIKTNNELKHFSSADFIIQVSATTWELMNQVQKETLLLQQLMKLYVATNEKTGEYDFKLIPPQYQTYKRIINAGGVEVFEQIKALNASINDLTPAETDGVKW